MACKTNKKFSKKLLVFIIMMIIILNFKVILRSFFPLEYEESILRYSKVYNIDPNWIASVINTESKFNCDAISSKGAMGLMQIMPDTGAWIGELIGVDNFEDSMLMDPDININFGTWYLNRLSNDFNGNYDLILASYNGGPGNVNRWLGDEQYSDDGRSLRNIPFNETKNYVKKVKLNYKMYKFLYDLEVT